MGERLRVVSLNTWKCDGNYPQRLNWMADGLRALDPDIVFLQEAFECHSTGDDTADFLGRAQGLHVTQVWGREKLRHHFGEFRNSRSNLAMLTRKRPVHLEALELVPCDGDQQRMVQIADLSISNLPMRLCNTHLTHIASPSGDTARMAQAEQLLRAAVPPDGGLAIFGGDLNARPQQVAIQKLADAPGILAPDNYNVLGTFHGQSVDDPVERETLDYIFVMSGQSAPATSYKRAWKALDTPIGPDRMFPSDHAAVVADIDLP